jgi:Domain of unknown function (DUF5753)/Helix-turn-helix domain
MAGKPLGAAGHFGRQMRKERQAHGWSLPEFATRVGFDAGHLSRIENAKRPPSEALAKACDQVFPERRGWFLDWYEESREWAEVPAGFRSWSELEDSAASIRAWVPGIVHGLVQAEGYARSLLSAFPGASVDAVSARLNARMERQRRLLMRDDPPLSWFVVDEIALYRQVGTAQAMAEQMCQLAAVAAMPTVTVQILPTVTHAANASGFIVADDRVAYAEHVAGGYVFSDSETVSSLLRLFDSLRCECLKVSESTALIERLGEQWTSGASPRIQTPTAGTV